MYPSCAISLIHPNHDPLPYTHPPSLRGFLSLLSLLLESVRLAGLFSGIYSFVGLPLRCDRKSSIAVHGTIWTSNAGYDDRSMDFRVFSVPFLRIHDALTFTNMYACMYYTMRFQYLPPTSHNFYLSNGLIEGAWEARCSYLSSNEGKPAGWPLGTHCRLHSFIQPSIPSHDGPR